MDIFHKFEQLDTKTIIITVIILAALVAILFYKIYTSQGKEKAKEAAIKFLNTLTTKFEEIIILHLKDIDFDDLNNLSEVEEAVLNDTIDALFIMVQEELANYSGSEADKQLIKMIVNRDFLVSFVKKFIQNDAKVQQAYSLKYYAAAARLQDNAVKLEEDTVKQNQEFETIDPTKVEKAAHLENGVDYDYSEGTRENPGKVIDKPLNPQPDITDEELTYSTEDDSIEVLDEDDAQEKLKREINKPVD